MSAIGNAASGLYAATQQLNVAATNLANSQDAGVQTAGAAAGDVSALGSTAPVASPASSATAPSPSASIVAPRLTYQPLQLVLYSNADVAGGGVSTTVQPTSPAAYAAYGPSSSYAAANGQVSAPNLDLPAQIANQASALIQFQANLKVIETSDRMQKSLLDQSA